MGSYTTSMSNVRLSYAAVAITSTRISTLRSAMGATTGKTRSKRTANKQIRLVVTKALNSAFIFPNLTIHLRLSEGFDLNPPIDNPLKHIQAFVTMALPKKAW